MSVSSRIPSSSDDPELASLRPQAICVCPSSGLLYALCVAGDEQRERHGADCVAVIDSSGLLVNTIGVPGADVGIGSTSEDYQDRGRDKRNVVSKAAETPGERVRRLKREELQREKGRSPLLARTKQRILPGGLAPLGASSRSQKQKSQAGRVDGGCRVSTTPSVRAQPHIPLSSYFSVQNLERNRGEWKERKVFRHARIRRAPPLAQMPGGAVYAAHPFAPFPSPYTSSVLSLL